MMHISSPAGFTTPTVSGAGVSRLIPAIFLAVLCGISLFAPASAADDVVIYKVTATSLIVREGPGVQHKALYTLPRNAYVLSHTGMQDQKIVTVANQKGRWINVSGRFEYTIGYVFEGFLAKETTIDFYPVEDNCEITRKSIKCGNKELQYSEKTPLTGAWFKNPESADGNIQFVYENDSRLLKKIMSSPGKDASPGGYFYMLVQDNRIVQFITAPPPRGGGGE